MATTLTPQLQLNLPEVGASRDTWGALLNSNFTDLDEFVSMAMPIGAILDFAGPNAPAGWLICDGRQLSRTTYSALFAVIDTYWGAGDGSTTFNLPNTPGRASIAPGTVIDANGGSYSFAFAQTAGAVTQFIQQANLPMLTLTTDTQGPHAHGGYTAAVSDHTHVASADLQGYHAHNVQVPITGYAQAGSNAVWSPAAGPMTYIQTDYNPAHSHNITVGAAGGHAHTIGNDGQHWHYVSLNGGGTPLSVLTPILVVTKIIYAGLQASPYIAGTVVAPSALETADELSAIRQELAELRALFAPPLQRRIAAPMRGTH